MIGQAIGPYEIVSKLGQGGMGEVYRARDRKLGRDVALKVLPELVAADPERLARFHREAQMLAALNHPHIAQIYGFEDSGASHALVMELVEGATLAALIARGRLPLDEALGIAKQIAEALEAAHDQGIVHRDLKPANVKVRSDGTVKVLDFGLAKLTGPAESAGSGQLAAGSGVSMSPTITSPVLMTGAGMILGTAAYMSPEQAAGKPVDKRSDIWSFGCIVFEMLTGRRPFDGQSVTEVLAAVLKDDPPWHALPATTPPATRRLLRRCLERDPRRRLHDIADARLELDETDAPVVAQSPVSRPHRAALLVAITLVAAVAGAAVAWVFRPIAPAPLRKLEIGADLTGGVQPTETSAFEAPVRLSPDGSRVAYIARGHLWVRDLGQTAPRDLGELPEDSFTLTWSPDSAFVAFASGDRKYRKVAVTGGPPVVVCDLPGTGRITGAAWTTAGSIILAAWRDSLYKVPASGGTPELWLKVDPSKEVDFHAPVALPDGRVAFRTHTRGTGADEVSLVEMFDGTTRSVLLRENGIGDLAYAPPGHLLFVRQSGGGSLWAVPFDAVPLDMSRAFAVDGRGRSISAGANGVLLVGTPGAGEASSQLVRVDRTGRALEELVPAGPSVSRPMFSPDGRFLAYHTHAGGNPDVWVMDLSRKVPTRLTFEAGEDQPASWFAGERRLLYTRHADEVEGSEIAAVATDGSEAPRGLVKGLEGIVSEDGRFLVYLVDDRGFFRVRVAERRDDGSIGEPRPLFRTEPEPTAVFEISLSPDGRLLAYEERGAAGESGVFVTRFPSGEGRWQVGGADEPRAVGRATLPIAWNRASNELLYFSAGADASTFQLMSVAVTSGPAVTLAAPVPLFAVDVASAEAGFDVAPDGKSLVIARDTGLASGHGTIRTRFTLVENWLSEFAATAR